jgi:hypothetical protein
VSDIDKMFLAILVISVVIVFACECWNSPQCGISMQGPANISVGNSTAIFATGTFEWNRSFMNDLEYNQSFHIPANATENWTIWKGDEVVCYIPR